MKNYSFVDFLKEKQVSEGMLSNLALAGALATGAGATDANAEAGKLHNITKPDTVNLKPEYQKELIKKIKDRHTEGLSDEDSKLFGALKEKGMKDFYLDYLIRFYRINKKYLDELKEIKSLKDLYVPKKDIDFYKTLRRTIILSPFELDKLKDKKTMTQEEESFLYDFGNDYFTYLDNHAFSFNIKNVKLKNIEIFLPDELLKLIVFNEKMKYEHDLGIQKLKVFLDKHKIQWGDTESLAKLMNKYEEVLNNYMQR